MKGKCVRASFTVEAAFICPIVLFAVFTLLCHAFRLHDRVLERTALSLELSGTLDPGEGREENPYTKERERKTGGILNARIYSRENEICLERGIGRVSGRVGDYKESRSTVRPEDILRQRAVLEEE